MKALICGWEHHASAILCSPTPTPLWLDVSQMVLYFCMFALQICNVWTNESVLLMVYSKSAAVPCLWWCVWLQRKVEHCLYPRSPFSSLRLLSGPGSPKTRAFTLHCACYSSQHSTHGHVSVFIALNVNFHSHHVPCLRGIFLLSQRFALF